ncbi:MAG: substrate-binding domain-containing protein [Treponema sp.]|jgi:ABC-type sugar transport system substrate-binding protein|nr:substrate-binding domain-containing protein [Treponema sp.]
MKKEVKTFFVTVLPLLMILSVFTACEKKAESAAPAGDPGAFIPTRPQIKPPIPNEVGTVDVVAGIDAETKKGNYPQYNWTFAIHSYDPGYENSIIFGDAIREECAKYGIKTVEAFCNMDVSKYPSNYQNFIQQKVDLILDVGWLGNSGVVDIAMEADIPIVSYDVNFDGGRAEGPRLWVMGGDPAVAGDTVGRHMAKVIRDKWNNEVDALLISYTEAMGEPMRIRMQSAIDGMAAEGLVIPESKINWQDGGGETVKSQNIMASFLTAHPDSKKILVGASSSNVGQGMLAAVQTAGREADVMIYSYGAEQVAIDNFLGKPNAWVADVGYYVKQYGWLAVNTAIRVMNGENVPYWTSPENYVITYDSIADYKGY